MTTATVTEHAGLAPDPVLPHRDTILDPGLVATRLPALLGSSPDLHLGPCELLRVKYRVGESLRVVYEVPTPAGTRTVAGRMYSGGRSRRAHDRLVSGSPGAAPGTVALDRELDTVWCAYPVDRKLGDLRWLSQPTGELARAVGVPGWRATEVVQHVAERSVTGRAVDGSGLTLAYAKAYGPTVRAVAVADRLASVAAVLDADRGQVSAPRPVGLSVRHHLVMMETASGRPWSELPLGEMPGALGRFGGAVATLHDLAPTQGLPPFTRLRPDRLHRCAELVARARPDVAAAVSTLVTRLLADLPEPGPDVALHGDCHPGNALLDAEAVALLDLDQMGVGPAAADLGSLLARVRHAAVVGEVGPAAAVDLERCVLAGYAERGPLPAPRSLAWHTAAALLAERVLRAVNRVNRPALARLDALLATAHHLLDEGPGQGLAP